ncbi:uncharacterized protein LOC110836976 isoform X1 [Zootermopsis nevadensis]|uniref:uncharacterized protein LOC110836976 isoform X1 n=1 Tax=Zootermopsis nevadensis TaxID=136037 RepID=UPI000B8E5775|nr:uncharacterized protein LOC110836976 isoform X1 [Zootermopsis nevadensis]
MFRKNDIYKIGSHKGSLQDRGREGSFPPSKKARLGDNYTAQQARVEDDVWGEDLDANTVEECFILASQALSQTCIPEISTSKEQPQAQECHRVQPTVEQFQKSAVQLCKQKQTATFTKNVTSSRWSETFPRKIPSVSKHVEILPTSIPSSTGQAMIAQRNTATLNYRTLAGNATTSSSSVSSIKNINTVNDRDEKDLLIRELQQLKLAYQKLQDHALTKEGEVSILRTQLNCKNAEVETERLTKAREIESQAQENRDRMKDLQKQLEQMKTQLEFKTLEVGNAEERCRLLESQTKVKLVEPQLSQTPQKFPKKLPVKGNSSLQIGTAVASLKPVRFEIHVPEGPMLSRLVTPALFEKPVRGTEKNSCLGIRQLPLSSGEYGENLTPRGSTVNVTHTSISKLVLMDSLAGNSAQRLIQKVVWQCYLMLVKQRDLLELHKPPENKDKLKEQDLKVSAAAGTLCGGKLSIMTARPWFKNEQGVETRRALGLMGALALVSEYAAEYMSGMIRCKKFVTKKKLIKKGHSEAKPVHRKWLEPCKTVHPSKLKKAPISNKVREIIEQRILTNQAISRARASIRAAKCEKVRIEAEQETELEQKTTLYEPVIARTSKGSRRPPNPLVVYKKYLERCKAASEARLRWVGQESPSQNLISVQNSLVTKPGPSWISKQYMPSTSAVSGHNLNCDQNTATRKVPARKFTLDGPFPDPSNELVSITQSKSALRMKVELKEMKKFSNKEQESDGSEEFFSIDQPGTTKDGDNMFKKPLPVKLKASKHKIVAKEAGRRKDNIRNRRYWAADKINAIKSKFPVVMDLMVNQKMKVARITKLSSEKACSQSTRKGQTARAIDLFETLHDIVLLICDKRLSVKFSGVLLGVTRLLRAISCRVEFKEDRCPVLARIVREMILCRPSVDVLMELTDLLFSLGEYRSIMETLCRGTGPSPYLGGTIGVVYFVKGKPQYDLGSNEEVEYFGKDSCMIALLCWILLVQRAGIKQYVVLASNVIKWLVCVSRQQEEGPYWIGSSDPETEVRDCQCRARIIEATIMLLHLCYSHIRNNNFQDDRLFRDIRHVLGRGLIFLHRLVHQDADVGLLMANAEGEYQVLIHGLIDNLKFMDFGEQEEEALKVLKDLEDQQDAHSPTLKFTKPAAVMDDIFKAIKSFCGPSYK